MLLFPLSIDNRPTLIDDYKKHFLDLDGVSAVYNPDGTLKKAGRMAEVGGYLRSRPLSVAPASLDRSAPNYFALINFEREIHLALAAGIDGFVPDVFSTKDIHMLTVMLQAAENVNSELNTHFSILPEMDALGFNRSKTPKADLIQVLLAAKASPAVARVGPHMMVASFMPDTLSPTLWRDVLNAVAAQDGDNVPAFIPVFLSGAAYKKTNGAFDSISYGVSFWSGRTTAQAPAYRALPAAFHRKNLRYMMSVAPQVYVQNPITILIPLIVRPIVISGWQPSKAALMRSCWLRGTITLKIRK